MPPELSFTSSSSAPPPQAGRGGNERGISCRNTLYKDDQTLFSLTFLLFPTSKSCSSILPLTMITTGRASTPMKHIHPLPFKPLPLQGWGSLESHLSLFVPVCTHRDGGSPDNKKGSFQAQGTTASSTSHSQLSGAAFIHRPTKIFFTDSIQRFQYHLTPKHGFYKRLSEAGRDQAGTITHGSRL